MYFALLQGSALRTGEGKPVESNKKTIALKIDMDLTFHTLMLCRFIHKYIATCLLILLFLLLFDFNFHFNILILTCTRYFVLK